VYSIKAKDIGSSIFLTNENVKQLEKTEDYDWLDIGIWGYMTLSGIFLKSELLEGDVKILDYIDHDIATAEKKVKGLYTCPQLGVNDPSPFADILRAVKKYLEKGDRYLLK